MKSNNGIYIFIGVILLLTGIYFIYTNTKTYTWYETYDGEDKNPFGNYVLVELLKGKVKSDFVLTKTPLEDELRTKEKDGNYIFIGDNLPLDSSGSKTLLKFVKEGNNAFIATNNPPWELFENLPANECIDIEEEEVEDDYQIGFVEDTIARFDLTHPKLKPKKELVFNHKIRQKAANYRWNYLDSSFFCSMEPKVILMGTLNDTLINFYSVKYGKGNFYFHTNPIAFTNYYLLEEDGRHYAESVFSHLKKGTIHWDEYSKMLNYSAASERVESPLKFILSEPGLRTALYITLSLILVYIVFYAKRKQRVIPLMESNANSSLEFTETIGRLYFQQHNHKKLCGQKMKFFLGFIRERYSLATNNLDTAFFNRLSLKSGVPLNKVQIIFNQYHRIKSLNDITEDTLINFHQALEFFYQNCK
ncbi:MAG TPA: DUF4350 domain-containing protein [Cytophagales bacterium]|nr:DUF4350 domain-containing protein [Cytophagales bacterium]